MKDKNPPGADLEAGNSPTHVVLDDRGLIR
jgi:hypothetical protein